MTYRDMIQFQRLVVEVNGVVIAQLILRNESRHELLIPLEIVRGRNLVDITFRVLDACSPQVLGISGDERHLGLRMIYLKLQPLGQAPISPKILSDQAILTDIESLGINCELGFVQRSVGAEPLSLFRWASAPLPNLLNALAARFDGIGDPQNIVVEIDVATEFQIIDRKYGFRNHSFAFQRDGARRETIVRREQRRIPFLARLLKENLEGGLKLFCFHDAGRSGRDHIEQLVAALNCYGHNTLLWVCPAENQMQVGTAEILSDRLIRGFVDRFEPIENVKNPSLEAWLNATRVAHALWLQLRAS